MIDIPIPDKIRNDEFFWVLLTSFFLGMLYVLSGNVVLHLINNDVSIAISLITFILFVPLIRYIAIPAANVFSSSLNKDLHPIYKYIISLPMIFSAAYLPGSQPVYTIVIAIIIGISVWFTETKCSAYLVFFTNIVLIAVCFFSIFSECFNYSKMLFIVPFLRDIIFGYGKKINDGPIFYLTLVSLIIAAYFSIIETKKFLSAANL